MYSYMYMYFCFPLDWNMAILTYWVMKRSGKGLKNIPTGLRTHKSMWMESW